MGGIGRTGIRRTVDGYIDRICGRKLSTLRTIQYAIKMISAHKEYLIDLGWCFAQYQIF
jgi:hypothetical protein